jgi:hypothetical protein
VRTSNVESAVRVRLMSNGVELRAVDAPVRLVGPLHATTLCVQPKGAPDSTGESCDARVTADMLPDAARGYDAFDRVMWSGGPPPRAATARQASHRLEGSKRIAFQRWQSLRELEDSGSLAGTPRVSRPLIPRGLPADSRHTVALGAALYMAALMAAGLLAGTRRGSIAGAYTGIALVACLGSTAALALGRVGPARAVVVQHSTLLQQLADGSGSAVSMRAIAEFPAFDAFTLRGGIEDAFIEPTGSSEKKEQRFDENGEAVLAGTFGLGAKQAFALEGFTALQPLALIADGARVRLTNRSAMALHDCRFGEGFSVREVGTLRPAQAVDAIQQAADIAGPVLTCTMQALPFDFSEASRVVEARGSVRVAVYRETEP